MVIHHIAIIASGSGTNARAILEYLRPMKNIKVSLLLSNRSSSGIPNIAREFGIPVVIINKELFGNESSILSILRAYNINFIVLAGFLWLMPDFLVDSFKNRILNIHPSLLPKYGGKGMYGINVHQAVFENKEKVSGITIHIVNHSYDEGKIVFQKKISIEDCNSAELIGEKILAEEHQIYPKIIVEYILSFKES